MSYNQQIRLFSFIKIKIQQQFFDKNYKQSYQIAVDNKSNEIISGKVAVKKS